MSSIRPLWGADELAAALGCPEPADAKAVNGICIDTRRLQPGDLFVALPGDPGPRFHSASRSSRDGHDYLAQAAAAGAAGALVSIPGQVPTGLPGYVVDNTIDGLWELGRAGRSRVRGPVFAITGSSGKTTTKNLLAAATGTAVEPGSLNNHLGVPLTLARLPAGTDIAIVEIGMNHPGEIAPLSTMTRPDVAIVVNVLRTHGANFDDPDGIRREKLSITAGLSPDGLLVVRSGIHHEDFWTGPTLTFGAADADAQVLSIEGDRANVQISGQPLTVAVPGGGAHRAESVVATLLACQGAGLDIRACADRLSQVQPPKGRGNQIQVGSVTVIDDSYNANPDSMKAALAQLATRPGPRTAVLGEMGELEDPVAAHISMAEAARAVDRLVLVGESMAHLRDALRDHPNVEYIADPAALTPTDLAGSCERAETVLVKGSNVVFWTRNFVDQLVAALHERDGADEPRAQR